MSNVMKYTKSRIGKVLAAMVAVSLMLFLAFLALGAADPAVVQRPVEKVLDHFEGYPIIQGTAPADNFAVLQDEFDQYLKKWDPVTVGQADEFFNPVKKTVTTAAGQQTTTPIVNRADHLVRYPITSIGPIVGPDWNVSVVNQFGQQSFVLAPATDILVPTQKVDVNGKSTNLPFPKNLDHYKWYPIIGVAGASTPPST